MDQILRSSNWDRAIYHKRINYYRTIEMERAAAVGRKYCNIELLRVNAADGYYDVETQTIHINIKYLIDPGTNAEGKDVIEHECTHADQEYYRNNPEKCKDPHIAVEYEIGLEVSDFESLEELEKNYAIYKLNSAEGEALQKGFENTCKAFKAVSEDDSNYIKYLNENKIEKKNSEQKIMETRPDLNSEEKVKVVLYDFYQKKVEKKVQMLSEENIKIGQKIIGLKQELKNNANQEEISADIDMLRQREEVNAKEIERLKIEKTLNPKLGEHFKTYRRMIEVERFKIITDQMKSIKNEAIEKVKQDPMLKRLIEEVMKEKNELNRLRNKKEKIESRKINKIIPFTKNRLSNLEEKIASQQIKYNQKMTKAENRSKQLNVQLRKMLKENPEYISLKEQLAKTKAAINEARKDNSKSIKENHLEYFTKETITIKTVSGMGM